MEELKTAAYSFQVPLQAGALLAGADAEEAAALGDIGSQLGVAYQLIDDVLGTFGDPAVTGKSIESDLREGKSTILTAMASTTPAFAANLQLFREHRTDVCDAARKPAAHRRRILCPAACRGTLPRRHPIGPPAPAAGPRERRTGGFRLAHPAQGGLAPMEHTALERYTEAASSSARVVITQYSTSFSLACRMLDRASRRHISNIYALVRLADEVVDGVAREAGLDRRPSPRRWPGSRPRPRRRCSPATAPT